jgi:uncharacterized paraquat-inducible protein A
MECHINNEYIYYTVTSSKTVKFGKTCNKISRQKAHYTSSPFLQMYLYKVNDAHIAEKELKELVKPYKIININSETELENTSIEHYTLTEDEAKYYCQLIYNKYNDTKLLDDRLYCVGCKQVTNISTLNKNDGFRCKRCYIKIQKEHSQIFF